MRIFIAGHRGMVGGAILRALEARRAAGEPLELVTRGRDALDLTDQRAVRGFMQEVRPDAVILAAAKVGGIHANNSYPADEKPGWRPEIGARELCAEMVAAEARG